ncbi:MAG: cobamide remodeling phosphodiesterase CbiR [Synergistes sp.]|nr:cobamide remodeling phosphodiesterase CbiR [Synergistes sp.]
MMDRICFGKLLLGGTSWIVPGTFAENMCELSRETDSMMFVLFDGEYGCNIPDKAEISELVSLKKDLDMEVVVHFPRDICRSEDTEERRRCEDSCIRMMELFEPLDPFGYILHLDGEILGEYPSRNMTRWTELTHASVLRLAAAASDKTKICAETLDYNFRIAYPITEDTGISICLDIGHLVRYGHNVAEQMNLYMPTTRVIHIHGVSEDGTDHLDMSCFDAALFRDVTAKANEDGKKRLMILEVFEEDYKKSLNAIKKYMGA